MDMSLLRPCPLPDTWGYESSSKSLITRGCFTSGLTSKSSREILNGLALLGPACEELISLLLSPRRRPPPLGREARGRV